MFELAHSANKFVILMYLSKLCLHYQIFKLTDNDCGKIKSSILCLKTSEISFFGKKRKVFTN